ncbi:MAG: DNA repair protein RecO [Chloroflexi bacterium]|nr:DNA repair protein RecO [Chloroflexota bacterium]
MSRPRTYTTEAIVLRASPMGEADRLLTLLTPAYGKLQATARGVRKTTSKLGGHLDLLTRSSLTLSHGQSLDTVTSAEALETFQALKSSLPTLSKAIYLAELADAFHPLESPGPAAYALLLEALRALETPADAALDLRYCELHFLGSAGFLPELGSCTQCQETLLPGHHYLSPAGGGVLCPACKASYADSAPISVDALKVLRYLSMNSLATALRVKVRQPLHRELAAHMSNLLRYTLEREMRSGAFLRAIAQHWPQEESAALTPT